MAHRVQLAASILSADMGRLAEETQKISAAGVDMIHVDIMDGLFVPNLTFGPQVVRAIHNATHLPLDVHLMIEQPERWIDRYVEAGAHTIQVHVESCKHLHQVLHHIRQTGVAVGVVLNPATPLCALDHVLDCVDRVLLMTVNPGFGGQSFITELLPKIQTLHNTIVQRGLSVCIAVDGGINPQTAPRAVQAGAQVLVAGSFLFANSDYQNQVQTLRLAVSPNKERPLL